MKLTKSKLKQIIKEEFSQMSGEENLGRNPSRLRPLNEYEEDFYEAVEIGVFDLYEKIKKAYLRAAEKKGEGKRVRQDFITGVKDTLKKIATLR